MKRCINNMFPERPVSERGKQASGWETSQPGHGLRPKPTEGGLTCSHGGAPECVTSRTVLTRDARCHTSAPVIGQGQPRLGHCGSS